MYKTSLVQKAGGRLEKRPILSDNWCRMKQIPLFQILSYHGLPTYGTKEELIPRLLLVCQRRYYLCFREEENELLETISLTQGILLGEKRQFVINSEYTFTEKGHRVLSNLMAAYKYLEIHILTTFEISSNLLRMNTFQFLTAYAGKKILNFPLKHILVLIRIKGMMTTSMKDFSSLGKS